MNNIPIVLMHTGDSFYLKYCIKSIKRSNPNSKIYLIGENVKEVFLGVTKLDMNDYKKYAKEIEKSYVHCNTSNPRIELFCIKRWFVLLDFMEKNNLKEVCASDSDVILYQNLEEDRKFWGKYDYVLAKERSAGFSFFTNIKVLKAYVDFVNGFYDLEFYHEEYEDIKSITDMFFWEELKNVNCGKGFSLGDISTITNHKVYCIGVLNEQNSMIMNNGMKRIFFLEGKPYVTIQKYSKDVDKAICKNGVRSYFLELKSIHCQAGTKFYMKYFLEGKYGFKEKLECKLLIFLRNTLSPIMGNKLRNIVKRIMGEVI